MIESDYLKDDRKLIQKLKEIPTFNIFDEKELYAILELSKVRKYGPGELILKEGSYDNWVYFIVSGKVKVVKHNKELHVLKRKGDVFGEMGIIDGSPRSASVYAIDETLCMATDVSYIDRLVGYDKLGFGYVLYRVFSEILAKRLRLANEALIEAKEEIARLIDEKA